MIECAFQPECADWRATATFSSTRCSRVTTSCSDGILVLLPIFPHSDTGIRTARVDLHEEVTKQLLETADAAARAGVQVDIREYVAA